VGVGVAIRGAPGIAMASSGRIPAATAADLLDDVVRSLDDQEKYLKKAVALHHSKRESANTLAQQVERLQVQLATATSTLEDRDRKLRGWESAKSAELLQLREAMQAEKIAEMDALNLEIEESRQTARDESQEESVLGTEGAQELVETLRQELDVLRASKDGEIASLSRALETSRAEGVSLKEACKAASTRAADLDAKLGDAKMEASFVGQRLSTMGNEIASLEAQLRSQEAESARLAQERDESKQKLLAARADLDEERKRHEGAQASLRDELAALREAHQKDLATLQGELEELKQKQAKLQQIHTPSRRHQNEECSPPPPTPVRQLYL
jgi:hypothetical protein